MEKSKYGVHARHCCEIHGCKYGNDDCPVVHKQVEQEYTCEYCKEDGFNSVEDIREYTSLKEEVKEAKVNGVQTITLSVELLDKWLNRESIY